MIFTLENIKDGKPHEFFALFPKKLSNGNIIWLETYWKRWIPPCAGPGYNVIGASAEDYTGYWIIGANNE